MNMKPRYLIILAVLSIIIKVNTATSQITHKGNDVRMRCAIYIRVSTDKEEQKASLKYQKELFYRYIEEKGWDIYEFCVDVQTGTTGKRKNLQK